MAARKGYLNFGGGEKINPLTNETQFEFDESEVWNSKDEVFVSSDQTKKSSMHSSRPLMIRKPSKKTGGNVNQKPTAAVGARSLPVNVPDWSRILGKEYTNRHMGEKQNDVDESDGDDEYGRLPPHEYLARTRGSSFSVHEGAGRTLKGRDLRRVRTAVLKQTGLED